MAWIIGGGIAAVIGFVVWMNKTRSFRQAKVDNWMITCNRCDTVFQLEPSDSFRVITPFADSSSREEIEVTCPGCGNAVRYVPADPGPPQSRIGW